jgi:hypothetical protein
VAQGSKAGARRALGTALYRGMEVPLAWRTRRGDTGGSAQLGAVPAVGTDGLQRACGPVARKASINGLGPRARPDRIGYVSPFLHKSFSVQRKIQKSQIIHLKHEKCSEISKIS